MLALDHRVKKASNVLDIIGNKIFLDLASAPPVGFNLTFICPEDHVFAHDWFATPYVFMTCNVCIFIIFHGTFCTCRGHSHTYSGFEKESIHSYYMNHIRRVYGFFFRPSVKIGKVLENNFRLMECLDLTLSGMTLNVFFVSIYLKKIPSAFSFSQKF